MNNKEIAQKLKEYNEEEDIKANLDFFQYLQVRKVF